MPWKKTKEGGRKGRGEEGRKEGGREGGREGGIDHYSHDSIRIIAHLVL
jgi:hypothetical protein